MAKTDLPHQQVRQLLGSPSFVNSAAHEAILSSHFRAFHSAAYRPKKIRKRTSPSKNISTTTRKDTAGDGNL